MINAVCHVEFVAEDIKAGAEFLEGVFGWHLFPVSDKYIVWAPTRDKEGGGIMPPEEWLGDQRTIVYIHVEDIEATLVRAVDSGGRVVHSKTRISEEHGFYGAFATPDGTLIGIWSRT